MITKQETGLNTGYYYVMDSTSPYLGGNIDGGDPNGQMPKVWDYLITKFKIRKVLDVGCGQGHNGEYFKNRGCYVLGLDGLMENVQNCKIPCVQWDLTRGWLWFNKFDLVWCREVVEHIEEKYLTNILNTFKSGKIVAFTHALPGQGGHHHVNCQLPSYWISSMEFEGFKFLEEDTLKCQQLQDSTLLIFERK